ncbi:MAG: hypothetical protein ACOC1K_01590 [Nanoarchaeota archaeon]
MDKIIIERLSKQRYELLEEDYDSHEANVLGDNIYDILKKGVYTLPFEFIITELTKLGHSPNIVYDDNGHFAISGDGFNQVNLEKSDMNLQIFIEKDDWKDNLRDALHHYFTKED